MNTSSKSINLDTQKERIESIENIYNNMNRIYSFSEIRPGKTSIFKNKI